MKSFKGMLKKGAIAIGVIIGAYAPSLFGQSSAGSILSSAARYVTADTTSLGSVTIGQSSYGRTNYQSIKIVSNSQKLPIVAEFSQTPGKPNEITGYTKVAEVNAGKTPVEFVIGGGISMDGTEFKGGKINTDKMGLVGKIGAVASRKFGEKDNLDLAAKLFVSGKIGETKPIFEAEGSAHSGNYSLIANALVNPNKSNVYSVMIGRKVNDRTTVAVGFERAKFKDNKYSNAIRAMLKVDITKKPNFKQIKSSAQRVF